MITIALNGEQDPLAILTGLPLFSIVSILAFALHGGSGNAGIAAACLNYNVSMCETNEKRCEDIRQRWNKDVKIWRERATAQLELIDRDNKAFAADASPQPAFEFCCN